MKCPTVSKHISKATHLTLHSLQREITSLPPNGCWLKHNTIAEFDSILEYRKSLTPKITDIDDCSDLGQRKMKDISDKPEQELPNVQLRHPKCSTPNINHVNTNHQAINFNENTNDLNAQLPKSRTTVPLQKSAMEPESTQPEVTYKEPSKVNNNRYQHGVNQPHKKKPSVIKIFDLANNPKFRSKDDVLSELARIDTCIENWRIREEELASAPKAKIG